MCCIYRLTHACVGIWVTAESGELPQCMSGFEIALHFVDFCRSLLQNQQSTMREQKIVT